MKNTYESHLSDDEIFKLERLMWLQQGRGVIDPSDIFDNHAKQVLIKHFNEKFGKQKG